MPVVDERMEGSMKSMGKSKGNIQRKRKLLKITRLTIERYTDIGDVSTTTIVTGWKTAEQLKRFYFLLAGRRAPEPAHWEIVSTEEALCWIVFRSDGSASRAPQIYPMVPEFPWRPSWHRNVATVRNNVNQ